MNPDMKITLPLIAALLLASLPNLHAAEAPTPRGGEKVIVSYDDGFSPFYSGRYKTAENLRKQMLLFKDTPAPFWRSTTARTAKA